MEAIKGSRLSCSGGFAELVQDQLFLGPDSSNCLIVQESLRHFKFTFWLH